MASSLLTTDKRWAAPARKSGMTVLGKIPKPINLPSQRLENHGVDPNVEIVPKGTLTWGSKPTPTTPNVWSSSSLLSPKNDGSSGSPNHFNGRPSSGGGSRPSTAGSESLDSPNAWGSSSRPSTASTTLSSHHLQMTNRPRSAETRPGSSQLSRFADNSSENVKVSIRTIDRLGSSSHGHGFTLSNGDFPTLGSDSNSQRGHSSKGRPTSSSGKEAVQNEQGKILTAGPAEVILSSNSQSVDNIKTEQHVHDGGAPFPATSLPNEAQQPQPYPANFCVPPPQFDSWHAPPGHPPDGMWHRGATPSGPYRPLGHPGGFPVEPFAYYGQFLPNSEAAARQGSGHGGYQPKNGDAYLSMPHNSYIMNQPVIPARPLYQGPMPYDGYYGPPRGNFNNSNVRDSPFVGGPHQPGILNQFPNQHEKFHPGHAQSRPGKHEIVPNEQLESDRVLMIRRGHPRILHDNPDRLRGPCEVERNAHPAPPLLPHPDGNCIDVNKRADTKESFVEKNKVLMRSVSDHRGPAGTSHFSVPENVHSHPRETNDGTLQKKLKEDNPVIPDPVIKKNVTLIEKIESLNNKARNVDANNIAEQFSSKEAKEKQQKSTGSKEDQKLPNLPSDSMVVEPSQSQITEITKARKLDESTRDQTHRRGDSSRNIHHIPAKDRSANNLAGQGPRENSATDSSLIVGLRNSQHDQSPEDALQLTATDDMSDSLDFESQRAKMREFAAQRAKQLQAEEEERTKQQRAKALAKLEELNMRSSVHQKSSNDAPPEIVDVPQKQNAGFDGTAKPASLMGESCDASCDSHNALQPQNDPKHTEASVQSKSKTLTHALNVGKDSNVYTLSSVRNAHSNMVEHETQKMVDHEAQKSVAHDISVTKPRQGYRRRQTVLEEKSSREKSSGITTESGNKIVEAFSDNSTIVTSHDEPLVHSKKTAKHPRNKKKVDEAPVTSPVVLNEPNTVKVPSELKLHTAGVIISSSIVPTEGTIVAVGSIMVGGISFGSLNQEFMKSASSNEAHSSHPRHELPKRLGKNHQTLRPVERQHGNDGVVWAPVKMLGQSEQSGEGTRTASVVAPTQPTEQNTNDGENLTRGKRAEMERYVPKPLSKELQHQNLGPNLLSEKSCEDNKSHDKEVVEKSTAAKSEAATEAKKWEGKKTTKGHGKSHSSWRRRNMDESTLVGRNATELADNYHEIHELQVQSDQHDKQVDAPAKNSSAPAEAVPLPVSVGKEHSAANRQRRQHTKALKTDGNNYPNENKNREGMKDVVCQMPTPPTLGMDSNSSGRRNMKISDAKNSGTIPQSRAHWKPKTNSHSQSNSQGNNAEDGLVDSAPQNSMSSNLAENSCGNDEKNAGDIEGKGETKHVDDYQNSESHENAEQQQLRHGLRRQGHHNGRYHRGGGTNRGRGHGTNPERRRGDTHLEYQPVGSYNKPTNFQQIPSADERTEGAQIHRVRGGHNRGSGPTGQFVKRNLASAAPANSYQDE
ncbi:hypothetical protein GUJ93_ZPchr0012g20796 [Zizania palustris]|uniref:BAT2 N-terminal domain-containing protein n=1 Tax=Zizania palustris TaxID=103762 RepID=A0A8J6BU92_ZIZPA|nr:hypothetical protein GUJ93_ZPchr0012g20796 [Zizania palustris]